MPEKANEKRKRLAIGYWIIVLFLFFIGFLYWLIVWKNKAYTDDAYVSGNQVYITPLHEGFITSIHTDDTYLVKKGDLLIELDRTDASIALDAAKENLAQTVRDVCQMFHQVFIYKAEIETRKAEYIQNAQDFQHRLGALPASGVSLEDYEHAVARLRGSYFSLRRAETLYEKSLSAVHGTCIKTHPLVLSAADRVRQAWVYLYRCNVYSPIEGLAAQRTIQVGMSVKAGEPMMSVIPLDQIWINANFKETQLRKMRIGQRVKITVDLYGDSVVYQGKIAGLPAVAGNAVSLLPPQNLSGNWIKIVQRLPVRVALNPEELKSHPLRIGLSTRATVDLSDPGPLIPTSTKNSPLYTTNIFEQEEKGDLAAIEQIVSQNLDPSLAQFAESKLPFTRFSPVKIPIEVQEALFENPLSPLQPPLSLGTNEH